MNMTIVSILAVFMMGMGIGFIYFIVRENERPVPTGGVQWMAVFLSGLLVVFSGFLLAMTLVPTPGVADLGTQFPCRTCVGVSLRRSLAQSRIPRGSASLRRPQRTSVGSASIGATSTVRPHDAFQVDLYFRLLRSFMQSRAKRVYVFLS